MQQEILHKATDMFLTLGFKSVTMDDIANELSISKKTIYQHFANKSELVKKVTMHLFESISCGIDNICALGKNPIEELYEIKNYVASQLKNESASPQYQLQKYYPKTHATLKKKHFDKMNVCVIENLNKGINLGLYRNEIDSEIICRFYFSGMAGIKDEELFPSKTFNIINIQNQYLEYHLRGICTPKGIELLEQLKQFN